MDIKAIQNISERFETIFYFLNHLNWQIQVEFLLDTKNNIPLHIAREMIIKEVESLNHDISIIELNLLAIKNFFSINAELVLKKTNPDSLSRYLSESNWKNIYEKDDLIIFRNGSGENLTEVSIPLNKERYGDFDFAILRALKEVAMFEKRDLSDLMNDLEKMKL